MNNSILIILALSLFFFGFETGNNSKEKYESEYIKNKTSNEEKDSFKGNTKLEAFISKKGLILIKDFHSLGSISGMHYSSVTFKAVLFYEPGKEKNSIRGIKIEIFDDNSESVFLDLEELESLSRALEYMFNLQKSWENNPKEYTEVIYETKGNFQVGFYKKNDTVNSFISAGYGKRVLCFLKTPDDLLATKSKIDDGIKFLNAKSSTK